MNAVAAVAPAFRAPIPRAPDQYWLSTKQAAAYLGVTPKTLLRWVSEGRVPAYALPGARRKSWRFKLPELERMMTPRDLL